MTKYSTLTNAPIAEAIIDIRLDHSEIIDLKKLKDITEKLKDQYPKIDNKYVHNLKNEFTPDGTVTSENNSQHIGYICRSTDGRHVIQLSTTGFIISELKPYSDWNKFSDEAKRIWNIFVDATSCERVSRVALRYINQMPMHIDEGEELSLYLACAPEVPKGLPQGLSMFLNRMRIRDETKVIWADITSSMSILENQESNVNLLLDIDAFIVRSVNVSEPDFWSYFEQLRDFKNDIFYKTVTKKTLERFE